jgi:hypothetical protein
MGAVFPSRGATPGESAPSAVLPYGNWSPAMFVPHGRSIGGIVAQVTIDETGEDALQITDHPVEKGAPISDHAFKTPVTVNIRAGWDVAHAKDLSAETGVYGLLLSWQAAMMPFDVITGKRSYSNMLMQRLSVVTDPTSEFALMATITCRQVIIVGTQTVEYQGMADNPDQHAQPDDTAPPQEKGEQPTTNPPAATSSKVETETVKNNNDAGTAKGIDLPETMAA